jgi:ligand-binding sensor domain-containing protein
MFPSPPLAFWVVSGLLILAIAVGYTSSTLQMTLGRLGWSHFTTGGTLLPSNTVYDIASGPDEQMVLGTERGAVIWSPPAATDLPDNWIVFTAENSGLPHNRVLAVAWADAGEVWFGTESGLGRYDGSEWLTYHTQEIGLEQDGVHALAIGSDGRLWVGTSAGVAVFDGRMWTPFTATAGGLVDDRVLSLAIDPRPEGDIVWFGSRDGISRLDTATGAWTSFNAQDLNQKWRGVIDLAVDSAGRLWAGTLGAGLGLWDGNAWQFYRTSNSELPFNTVNAITEVEPGVLWVGTALPTEVGGVLTEFDGETWNEFTTRNSGYSNAEPLAIATDEAGRRWIGTRTAGVDIFRVQR